MATDKQLTANRTNARKHSFSGSDFTIVKIEDRDAIESQACCGSPDEALA